MTVQIRILADGISQLQIGKERSMLLIIDDLVLDPQWLQDVAANGTAFSADPANFYPGIRKTTPPLYQQALHIALLPLLKTVFQQAKAQELQLLMSAYSLSTTPPSQLRPIQMLPHIDTTASQQLAMVHYLCGPELGGTSFYRHRQTGFERISQSRLPEYSVLLKAEAQAAQLHQQPAYASGDTSIFQRIYQVEAKPNRAIIYPGNLLHSGDIREGVGLSANPRQGRLTISSFLQLA
jgi:hypothetical protein